MKTIKINKVLIALDYDPSSQKVAEMGYSLAKTEGAGIILLHIIGDAIYYSSLEYSQITGFAGFMDMGQIQLDSTDALKNAALNFLEKTKLHLGDETIQIQVKDGDPADSILKAANDSDADIIVLGTHSRRWLENILLGSVAEKVLRHTQKPLLIIPIKKEQSDLLH